MRIEPGIYAATLVKNRIITAEQYKTATKFQEDLVKKGTPAIPLFLHLQEQGILNANLHEKVWDLLKNHFTKSKMPVADQARLEQQRSAFVKQCLRRNLLTKTQVFDIKHMIVETGTHLNFGEMAVNCGYLTPQTARALQKYIDAQDTQDTAIQFSHQEEAPAVSQVAAYGQRPETREFVTRFAKSREHIEILDFIQQGNSHVVDLKDVVGKTGKKKKVVQKILKFWCNEGILKKIDGTTYNFSPSESYREQSDHFFTKWRGSNDRTRLLGYVISEESK